VDQIFVSIANRNRQNMSGHLGGECKLSGRAISAILGHEQASAASNPANRPEKTTATRHLRMCRHLNRGAHPGQLTSLGDDGLTRLKDEFEYRHGGANNIALRQSLRAKTATCKFSMGLRQS
jgi:hypothetical protein